MLNTLIKGLTKSLLSMQNSIEMILDIEEQKYDAIKNMEMEKLIFLNEEESVYIQKIESTENERISVVNQLSDMFKCPTDITISELVLFFPQDSRADLLKLCLQIKDVSHRLSLITEMNEYVLRSHSEIIGQILELTHDAPVDQYNSNGAIIERKQQSLHMLDQII